MASRIKRTRVVETRPFDFPYDLPPRNGPLSYIFGHFLGKIDFFKPEMSSQFVNDDFTITTTIQRSIVAGFLTSFARTGKHETKLKEFITIFFKKVGNSSLILTLEEYQPVHVESGHVQVETSLTGTLPEEIRKVSPMNVLNASNLDIIIKKFTETQNVARQFYVSHLDGATDDSMSEIRQIDISATLKSWKNNKFQQPKFDGTVLSNSELFTQMDTEIMTTYIIGNYNIGIYSDKIYNIDILTAGLNAWIQSIRNRSVISSGLELDDTVCFPLLKKEVAGGKITKPKYKLTKKTKKYKQQKCAIYEGPRGGKYIIYNKKYISLKSLAK
jgi:hypothetical protein